jgi:hypothetical protein
LIQINGEISNQGSLRCKILRMAKNAKWLDVGYTAAFGNARK